MAGPDHRAMVGAIPAPVGRFPSATILGTPCSLVYREEGNRSFDMGTRLKFDVAGRLVTARNA